MTDTIAIAGAGIAGLTCALALAARGAHSTVFDVFEKPAEIGAGLQVPPNASRVLSKLGALNALRTVSVSPDQVCLGDAVSGKVLVSMDVTHPSDADAPWLTTHRASLHGVLFDLAVRNPLIDLNLGRTLQDAHQENRSVTIMLGNRDDAHSGFSASCLVGADGIRSATRRFVAGAKAAEPTGRIALRAVVPSTDDADENRVVAWMMPDAHLVTYPMRNSDTRNMVAIIPGTMAANGWDTAAEASQVERLKSLLSRTAHGALVGKAEWTRWPLASVAPAAAWFDGRIALIGDAAHAIEPFAAQGAAMAIEDGYVMGTLLADAAGEPQQAFSRFEQLRRARVNRVVQRTEFNRSIYHQGNPARLLRNIAIQMRPASRFLSDLDWLYGHDATRI